MLLRQLMAVIIIFVMNSHINIFDSTNVNQSNYQNFSNAHQRIRIELLMKHFALVSLSKHIKAEVILRLTA